MANPGHPLRAGLSVGEVDRGAQVSAAAGPVRMMLTRYPQSYILRTTNLRAYKAHPPFRGEWCREPWRVYDSDRAAATADRDVHLTAFRVNSSPPIGRNPVLLFRRLGLGERGNHVSAQDRDRLLRASPSRRGACELGTAIRSRAQALKEARRRWLRTVGTAHEIRSFGPIRAQFTASRNGNPLEKSA